MEGGCTCAHNPRMKANVGWQALVLLAFSGSTFAAGPAPVDLRSTAPFAILSGAAITSTGGGGICGNAGASPITGAAIGLLATQVVGTIYAVDAAGPAGSIMNPALLTVAKADLTLAYNDAAARTPVPVGAFLDPGAGNIGGMSLVPGLYKFSSSALVTGADLTLTGGVDDVWIFQIGTRLEVGSAIRILLAGGAQARNVFWQVGSSATVGTYAVFKGTILADQAITLNTGSSLEGRALAFTAGITFNCVSGDVPAPEAPRFTDIYRTVDDGTTVVVETAPYFRLVLEACPDLIRANWIGLATNTPVTSPWSFTDYAPLAGTTQRFYRAVLSVADRPPL